MQNEKKEKAKPKISMGLLLVCVTIIGCFLGYLDIPFINDACNLIANIFIKLLKLVSLPIIFFSLLSTISGFNNIKDAKYLGLKVLKYTLLTTILSATVALFLYNLINPADITARYLIDQSIEHHQQAQGYWEYLLSSVPTNFIEPFISHNVLSVLFLSILLSIAVLRLAEPTKTELSKFFTNIFKAIMEMTKLFLLLMPLAVFAFSVLFMQDIKQNDQLLGGMLKYLICILLANFIQAIVILPLLLKQQGISPIKNFKAFMPAMVIAFFSKSSAAALASTIECAEKKANIHPLIARFSLPLCITINMNACAAYILITVMFISESNGIFFAAGSMILWVFVATIAAIGNAGVPMGCYMLSSAFLAAMGVPLEKLIVFLPLYAFVDMLESAINIWSDSCVTSIVNKKVKNTLN